MPVCLAKKPFDIPAWPLNDQDRSPAGPAKEHRLFPSVLPGSVCYVMGTREIVAKDRAGK